MENQNELKIDLLELLNYQKKKILIIAAAFAACAVARFLVSSLFITPKYTASTRVYVLNRTNETNVVYADFQTSTQMLNDSKVLILGENVTKEVIKELNLDMKPQKLANKIHVTSPDNTRVLQISVTDSDPELAASIANTVRQEAVVQLETIMAVDAVNLVYEASVPTAPSSPNVMRNTALAALLGLVGAVAVLSVVFVLDDTIRTEEDVERYLGLSTMGVIPESDELNHMSGRAKGGKTARKVLK